MTPKVRSRQTLAVHVFAATLAVALGSAGAALSSSGSTSAIPNGTYRTSFTNDQLRGPGVGPQQRRESVGAYTLKIASGKWKIIEKSPTPGASGVYTGSYSYYGTGSRVSFLHKTPPGVAGVTLKFVWSFDGKALHLKAVPGSGFPAPVVRVIWTRHAWTKTG